MNAMWRAPALRLLVRLRLLRRPDLIGRTVARHPTPMSYSKASWF